MNLGPVVKSEPCQEPDRRLTTFGNRRLSWYNRDLRGDLLQTAPG